MLFQYFPQLWIKNPDKNYVQIRFMYLLATTK